jgi:uncharacterized protein YrrD
MTDNEAPEDLGAPVSSLVLADGTAVYDRSGARVGKVEHVLADEKADVFHGLTVRTPDGHRFAPAAQIDGLFEKGVIVAVPAAQLPSPSADPAAQQAEDDNLVGHLRSAWEKLVKPK